MQRKVKHQVFISSTYKDLQEERWAVLRSLLSMDCIVSGMELFPAIDMEQFDYIKQIIDDCDYYVLILGGRYGSESPAGLSYTEMEYDYACSKGIPVIAMVYDKPDELPIDRREIDPEALRKFRLFRTKAANARLVRFWSDIKELQLHAMQAFHHAEKNFPALGWVRANTVASEDVLLDLNNLRKENEQLRIDIAHFQDKLDPKIKGLVPLEGVLHLEFNDRHLGDDTLIAQTNWKNVFLKLYNQFRDGIRNDFIRYALCPFLPNDRIGMHNPIVTPECTDKIINQFIAHNLIERTIVASAEDGAQSYYYLTEVGMRFGLENIAIKDPPTKID